MQTLERETASRCRGGCLMTVSYVVGQTINKKWQKFNLRRSKRKLFAFNSLSSRVFYPTIKGRHDVPTTS